jgi:vacuolar-type H+-ATPase catalytic subunit A/Vma1
MSEDSPYSRPLVLPGAAQGPAVSAANVSAINEQFRIINQNFQGIDKLFDELRYNVRAAINEDVGKLRDEITRKFDVEKIRDDIREEVAEEAENKIELFRLDILKIINETFDTIHNRLQDVVDWRKDVEKIHADIRKEFATITSELRVETFKTINDNLNGADKTLAEFGFNVRKAITEDIGKARDEFRKEFSVNNLVAEISKANATEIAALRADTTIQLAELAAMRADIAHFTKRNNLKGK